MSLSHQRNLAHLERLATLRRQVYPELQVRLTQMRESFGRIAGEDPSSKDFGRHFNATICELSKAQLVGERETSSLSQELATVLGETLFALLAEATPVHAIRYELEGLKKHADDEWAEVERLNAEINAALEAPDYDKARVEMFQQMRDLQINQRAELVARLRETSKKQFQLMLEYGNVLATHASRIAPVEIRLLRAIRDELGLDTDVRQLEQRWDEAMNRTRSAAQLLFDAWSNRLAQLCD